MRYALGRSQGPTFNANCCKHSELCFEGISISGRTGKAPHASAASRKQTSAELGPRSSSDPATWPTCFVTICEIPKKSDFQVTQRGKYFLSAQSFFFSPCQLRSVCHSEVRSSTTMNSFHHVICFRSFSCLKLTRKAHFTFSFLIN